MAPDHDFFFKPRFFVDHRLLTLRRHVNRPIFKGLTRYAGGRAINLTAGYDEDAQAPMWSKGSDTLYFHAEVGASTLVAAVSRAGGPVMLSTDRVAAAGAPVAATTGRAAWVQSQADAPGEVDERGDRSVDDRRTVQLRPERLVVRRDPLVEVDAGHRSSLLGEVGAPSSIRRCRQFIGNCAGKG